MNVHSINGPVHVIILFSQAQCKYLYFYGSIITEKFPELIGFNNKNKSKKDDKTI